MRQNLICLLMLFTLLINGQSNYQKSFTQNLNTLSETVYTNEYNTTSFNISNYFGSSEFTGVGIITKFTTSTGAITSSKTFSISGYDLSVRSAVKKNSSLFIAAAITNSIAETGAIFKYNLSTNSIVWKKEITMSQDFSVQSITFDNDKYLYLLGSSYNDVNSNNDIFVSKIDSNGVLLWTKVFGEVTWDEYPSQIVYNGKRELYISSVGYVGVIGRATVLRLDSAGNILNTKTLTTSSSPRFGASLACIVNNKCILVNNTIVGPSDPGPVLIRTLDTNLVAINSTTINGISVKQAFGNGTTLLLSGSAPVTSGFPGMRSIRYDVNLNLLGARYFNKINTFSIASSGSCFINSLNQSIHNFKPGGNDTLFVIKTDSYENSACRDTIFTPSNISLSYTTIPYTYSLFPVSSATANITLSVSSYSVNSNAICSGVTTQINEVVNNQSVIVYPNPTSSILNIYNTSSTLITLTDITGKKVLETNDFKLINLSQLQNGLYFLQLFDSNNNIIEIKKIVKIP